ncbi:GTPase [Candidatus Harpocratesius sp.]
MVKKSSKNRIKFSYPRGNFPRLCLIGNSNVGKSSLTRLLLSHPKWYKSKVGKTAGSTIRLTIINDPALNYHVIDLPGFGRMVRLDRSSEGRVQDQILRYIQLDQKNIFLMLIVISLDRLESELEKWFFQNQETIPLSIELVKFMLNLNIPCLLVLNKVDKLNSYKLAIVKEKLNTVLNEFSIKVNNDISSSQGLIGIIETSTKNKTGIKALKQIINSLASKIDLSRFDSRNKLMDLPPINQK